MVLKENIILSLRQWVSINGQIKNSCQFVRYTKSGVLVANHIAIERVRVVYVEKVLYTCIYLKHCWCIVSFNQKIHKKNLNEIKVLALWNWFLSQWWWHFFLVYFGIWVSDEFELGHKEILNIKYDLKKWRLSLA